ncbi:phosphoribosyltransferase-like protein [Dunaliella salina]|uniref:Phosphoribosyltransferase-like protein n=1 Tax=Dunaliella salina TaxID=3046 RepID=A0ABZ3LBP2_DUNSA|nr:phosphoribosyltransferase-like protein [Dunaliella salina]|eukprot:KAF5838840.1 phosphoribosyltransferase-like protein [Dunaliella salina]
MSATYDVNQDIGEVLFTEEQIKSKIKEMGRAVAKDFVDKAPVVMPILKGGFTVAADLVRSLDPVPKGVIVEFVAASSYGAGTETSGTVKVSFDASVVKDRHVLLVDDLVDSGLTLSEVHRLVQEAGAASVK